MKPSERINEIYIETWNSFSWWEKLNSSERGVTITSVIQFLDEQWGKFNDNP